MRSLQKIIQSLSSKEKGDFKRLFQMKSKTQDFIRLFDLLNRGRFREEADLRKLFHSPSKYSQLKKRLESTLLLFISNRELTERDSLQNALRAAQKFIFSEHYETAGHILERVSKYVSNHPGKEFSTEWVSLFNAIPSNLLSARIVERSKKINENVLAWKEFEKIRNSYNSLGRQKANLLAKQEIGNGFLNQLKEMPSSKQDQLLWCEKELLARKILTRMGKLDDAVSISKSYLNRVKSINIPPIKKEERLISEYRNLVALFLANEDYSNFFQYQKIFSSLNFLTQGGKLKAIFHNLLFQVTWAGDTGANEFFETLADRFSLLESKNYFRIHQTDAIRLHFNYAKYCLIIEKIEPARKSLTWIENNAFSNPAFQIVLPFIFEFHIIIALKQGETYLLDSNLNKLKRWKKRYESESKFFELVFQCVNLIQKNQPGKLGLHSLSQQFNTLKDDKEYRRLFDYSLFPEFVKSEITNCSLLSIRREGAGIKQKDIINWLKRIS